MTRSFKYLTHEFIFFECFFDDIKGVIQIEKLISLLNNIINQKSGYIFSKWSQDGYFIILQLQKLKKKLEDVNQKRKLPGVAEQIQILGNLEVNLLQDKIIQEPEYLKDVEFKENEITFFNHHFYSSDENHKYLIDKTMMNHEECTNDDTDCNKNIISKLKRETYLNITLQKYYQSELTKTPILYLSDLKHQEIESLFKKLLYFTNEIHLSDRYIAKNFINYYTQSLRSATRSTSIYQPPPQYHFDSIKFLIKMFFDNNPDKNLSVYIYSDTSKEVFNNNSTFEQEKDYFKDFILEEFPRIPNFENINFTIKLYEKKDTDGSGSRLDHDRYIFTDHHSFSMQSGLDFGTYSLEIFKPNDGKRNQIFFDPTTKKDDLQPKAKQIGEEYLRNNIELRFYSDL